MRIVKSVFTVLLLLIIAGGVAENYLKDSYRDNNLSDPAINQFVLYSDQIHREPYKKWIFKFMNADGVQIEAYPQTNNHGYFSIYDYQPDDINFNILVIGGEQTASSTVSVSWPDHLQDLLGDGHKVYNIAWPDAGPSNYINYWNHAKDVYKPDLVIINFVGTDFLRGQLQSKPLIKFKGRDTSKIYYEMEFPRGKAGMFIKLAEEAKYKTRKIENGQDQILNADLTDPNLIPSRPYGMFVDQDVLSDNTELMRLKEKVVTDMVEGAINYYGCMTCAYLSGETESVHVLRNFDPLENLPSTKEEELVKYGRETFGWMATKIPNVIFVRSFSYPELRSRTEAKLANTLMETLDDFHFYDARNYVPDGNPDNWFYTPWMAEKLSAEGMKIYAKAVFDIILERQRSKSYVGSTRDGSDG